MPTQKITLPIPFLRQRRRDAVMLLRLGAGANAMESALRLLIALADTDDRPAAMLARLQGPLAAIGYLSEIVKTIAKESYEERLWQLVSIAVDDGFDLGRDPKEARALLSPQNPGIGGPTLLKVRDKIGFHWDPQPFESYVDSPDLAEVSVWESDGVTQADRVFRGSADATARFVLELEAGGRPFDELLSEIVEAHGTVGRVVEAAWLGLIIESGAKPTDFFGDS